MKPNEAIIAGFLPCQDFVIRACKYEAKTSHVINAQVSLGSQLQYEPQASLAQTAPAIIHIVNNGKPKLIVL